MTDELFKKAMELQHSIVSKRNFFSKYRMFITSILLCITTIMFNMYSAHPPH